MSFWRNGPRAPCRVYVIEKLHKPASVLRIQGAPALLPKGTGAPTPEPSPQLSSPSLVLTAHLGLTLSCKAGAQDIHRVHGEGSCPRRQAATYEVRGELVRLIQVGSVKQFRQLFKGQKLQKEVENH